MGDIGGPGEKYGEYAYNFRVHQHLPLATDATFFPPSPISPLLQIRSFPLPALATLLFGCLRAPLATCATLLPPSLLQIRPSIHCQHLSRFSLATSGPLSKLSTRVSLFCYLHLASGFASFAVRPWKQRHQQTTSQKILFGNLKLNNSLFGSLPLCDCKIIQAILSLVSSSSWQMSYHRWSAANRNCTLL
jgi:hypothetical protein